ncbi:plasmid mobilization relaxosome protein MobC [Alcanivorax sp. NBRC 102028]|uniref:plasmid mobilization protein n=1 Tax=Alcanivorax sp. NBRC 102028 TaxID=1113897 RepID=UPI000789CDDB|nr:plasmid mobilization relaxosome protein MobC [Alcanivorax sp. NBRC 102028]
MASFRFELTEEENERLTSLATSQGVSKAKLLRWLISKLPGEPLPEKAEPKTPGPRFQHQLRIRLDADQYQAIQERATLAQWQSPSAWVYSLVVSHLENAPEFTDAEETALNNSKVQLKRIGNLLNQIAKAANQDPRNVQQLESINFTALHELVNKTAADAEAMLDASARRWGMK